jgi:hypothetical protein
LGGQQTPLKSIEEIVADAERDCTAINEKLVVITGRTLAS